MQNTSTSHQEVKSAVEWASINGLLVNPPDFDKLNTMKQIAPIMVSPSTFPHKTYHELSQIQPIINKLYVGLSKDCEFIKKYIEPLAKVDDFTNSLYKVYLESRSNPSKTVTINIFRADYMLNCEDYGCDDKQNFIEMINLSKPAQIEVNTISASFMGLSSKVTKMHQYIEKTITQKKLNNSNNEKGIVVNNSLDKIIELLSKAHELYGNKDAIVLMVVQENERNENDQLAIVQGLFEKQGIIMVRKTFREIHDNHKILDGELYLNTPPGLMKKVSIVYYRTGYGPNDYSHGGADYELRTSIEKSKSLKLPSIEMQLVGSKIVQQILTDIDLTKYIDKHEEDLVKKTFVKIFKLTNSSVKLAKEAPDCYVLKPSREGGGNNYFGSKIIDKLNSISSSDFEAYILMEKINPPKFSSVGVTNNAVISGDFVYEIGFFGCYLEDYNQKTIINISAGHLLRTKLQDTDEGGVNSGYSMIDSPYLINFRTNDILIELNTSELGDIALPLYATIGLVTKNEWNNDIILEIEKPKFRGNLKLNGAETINSNDCFDLIFTVVL